MNMLKAVPLRWRGERRLPANRAGCAGEDSFGRRGRPALGLTAILAGAVFLNASVCLGQTGAAPDRPSPDTPRLWAGTDADPHHKQMNIYLPWDKMCGRRACTLTAKVKLESGALLATAELIYRRDEEPKILRIEVPPGVQTTSGVRVSLDGREAAFGNYYDCHADACVAYLEWSGTLVAAMKKARNLSVQVINAAGKAVTISIPLKQFARASEMEVVELETKLESLRDAAPTQCAGAGSAACFWNSPMSPEGRRFRGR